MEPKKQTVVTHSGNFHTDEVFAVAVLDILFEGRYEIIRTRDPEVMGGKPCIRGMRVTVGVILGLLAWGRSIEEILREYPYLEEEDIREALAYGAWRSSEVEVEVGEVVVRGPNVTKGYLNRPEETAQAFRNGWFHTGDLGRVDEQGFMFLVDRKKDMVITGGENVYTSEVEAALYQHPNVFEAAVIGVPDERYGEALFAVIVTKPGTTLTSDEIIAHCRGRIGGYKIPRKMVFLEELPKSAMGKILKTELRKTYGGGTA